MLQRKSGQLSGAAAGGQNAWGHAQKAAPELKTLVFGLEWERSCEGIQARVQRKVPFTG